MALRLVGWIVADSVRAERMLSLTGLEPDALRQALTDPATLGALMDFVINHEPDLLACAEALEVAPADLVAARERLGR
ncbi:outer membrane protein TolC [Sphingobium sp. B11D3D]|nr:outer membrane protein TolC [Sphingobium sp. B12D2B]MCW2368372.1 outer membrane protein TolC [Sphingobium sp. B11D3D]